MVKNKIKCYFGMHEWTCAAEQNIKATPKQLKDGVDGFFDYAKMYCKHCGYVYVPTKKPVWF